MNVEALAAIPGKWATPDPSTISHLPRGGAQLAYQRAYERILRSSRVEPGPLPTNCRISTYSPKNKGYRQVKIAGKNLMIHRFIYECVVGAIPEGLHLDHLCRNPACFAPFHLEPVTCRVNILRGESTGALAVRTDHCKRGHSLADTPVINGRRQCLVCRRIAYAERRAA